MHVMAWYNNSVTNKNVVDPRNWKGYGNRSIDDMFFGITKMVSLEPRNSSKRKLPRAEGHRSSRHCRTSNSPTH